MGGASRSGRAAAFGQEHRLGGLLLLILVSLAFQLAAPDDDWARLVIVLLQGATLLGALVASGARKSLIRVAAVVVTLATATAIATLIGTGGSGASPARIVTLLLIALAPAAIVVGVVRDVREQGRVSLQTMFGVLCVYLLVGMFFSFSFNVIQELTDDPFFANGVSGDVSDFLYFSFSTLTTTGYGDLTAAGGLGRSLSITEALIGQIYLVTVVAMIVANMRPGRAPA
jgi:hypothetical protein